MKRRIFAVVMCLALCLCAACGADKKGGLENGTQQGENVTDGSGVISSDVSTDIPGDTAVTEATLICRVVYEENGSLLLAEYEGSSGEIYHIGTQNVTIVTENGSAMSGEEIKEGSLIEITYDGMIMESYPATPSGITKIVVLDYGFDNMCEMYLDVLEDLWETDEGLNSDIEMMSVDLSGTRLPKAEQAAVAWQFGGECGVMVLEASYEELVADGMIDAENLYWEDGCLFTITEKEMEGTYNANVVTFDAQKWRSGLGAYFFTDCTSIQTERGEWCEYQVGAEAIS